MDAKLAKLEAKLGGGPTPAQAKKEAKREKQNAKKQKKEIRAIAEKSLDPENWTKAVLQGGDAKFSSTVGNPIFSVPFLGLWGL